jgi:hypothetical protein
MRRSAGFVVSHSKKTAGATAFFQLHAIQSAGLIPCKEIHLPPFPYESIDLASWLI